MVTSDLKSTANNKFFSVAYFVPDTTRGYRLQSPTALAGLPADYRVRILTLLPNTQSVISVQFFSPISSQCFFCKNMTSTVDFSILYEVCFFKSCSLSPNCTGIRHMSLLKLYSKFASCFRTRLSAFHIRTVNKHTFTQ